MCVMYFECMQIWLETRTPIAGSWRVDNSNYQTISSISPPPPTPPHSLHHPIPPFSLSWFSVLLIVALQTISLIPNTLRVVVSWNPKVKFLFSFEKVSKNSYSYTKTNCVDLMEPVRMI